jgi:hypothetical protein
MIDIYHELGLNYQATEEILKNIFNVYIKIYYNITQDDFKQIIDSLNNSYKLENNKILQYYQVINNDLILENEITKIVDELKYNENKYNNIFDENHITQAVIHLNLQHINKIGNQKVDLYRIFDNFIVDDTCPFLQYQTLENKLIYKFFKKSTETDTNSILSKWFIHTPYGISFKIKINQKGDNNKYISVNLNENGKLEYKIQWKEIDNAVFDDVNNTFSYIRNLINKINSENDKLQITLPTNDKFKFAFINTIQKIKLPAGYSINHNDLSDFARLFYPYIAVVIEPKKRISKNKKNNNISKYGTYLRYKKVSKYEDETRIEHRILYFLKNYEYIEKILTIEISKQFNITETDALKKIIEIKQKYPYLKKSRNILKKLDNISKYKTPGINIDIQGKNKDNYKIRISGTSSKSQLNKIIIFMNILIHLYIETYLHKKSEFIKLKKKLSSLNNIAKRRNKVQDIIEVNNDIKQVKKITKLDKERLAYKPQKGQNQWTRNCQNSGNKKRRPLAFTDETINELLELDYIYNPKSKEYERKILIEKKGKQKEYTLRAAKLTNNDGTNIYYVCGPEENKKYKYIGFLSHSVNPTGLCMPCCFKKDHFLSKNKIKRDYYMKCINKYQDNNKILKHTIGEKLYILQTSNNVQVDRFCYLPKYLDIYFNVMLNKTKIIKDHYLYETKTGYFFKYITKQTELPYLNAIADAINQSIDYIKSKIIETLTTDNIDLNLQIFTSLNNGDIVTQFETIENYLYFLNVNLEIDHTIVDDILCNPNILFEHGLNILIFEKKNFLLENNSNNLNDYVLLCKNIENIYNIYDQNRNNIILIKEDNNYYPIYLVHKDKTKIINITKLFNYKNDNDNDNIIKHIIDYFKINCFQSNITFLNIDNVKTIDTKLKYINTTYNINYSIINQIIDQRNKCIYIVLNNNKSKSFLLPVKPSGIIWYYNITKNINQYINTLAYSIETLMSLYNLSIKNLDYTITCNIKGFIYNKQINNTKYNIIAILIEQTINLPIIPIEIEYSNLQKITLKYGINTFILNFTSLYDDVDIKIQNYNKDFIDKRIININKDLYLNESYELFRLDISTFLNNNQNIKNEIDLLLNNKIDISLKKNFIKNILYKITNYEIYKLFNEIINLDKSTIIDKIKYGNIINILPENDNNNDFNKKLETYKINNNRTLCKYINNITDCNNNIHCKWDIKDKNNSNICKLYLTKKNIILFINKITEELIYNELKSNEILQKDNYFVSDIVDTDIYKTRKDQKIIKNINYNIQNILSEIFGSDNIPIIGKKKINKFNTYINNDILNNILEKNTNFYSQIINKSNFIFRAYSNSFYWLKNKYADIHFRNLGYYNPLQTDLSNLFKSYVIDSLTNNKIINKMIIDLKILIDLNYDAINNFLDFFIKSFIPKYIGIIEYYILNQLHKIPIIIYDIYDQIFLIFDNGIVYSNLLNLKIGNDNILNKYIKNNHSFINIKYSINNPSINSNIINIYSIYFI